MKEGNGQRVWKTMKGIAAALLIAGCFFLLKQRLPEAEDLTGMAALTAVCIISSLSRQDDGMVTEGFLGGQQREQIN